MNIKEILEEFDKEFIRVEKWKGMPVKEIFDGKPTEIKQFITKNLKTQEEQHKKELKQAYLDGVTSTYKIYNNK